MKNNKIAIIGLGYVGLPLAIEFGKKYKTYGYDINQNRINSLKMGMDTTMEFKKDYILSSKKLVFVNKVKDLEECNIFIVTVPTPIFKNNSPDLRNIIDATKKVASVLKKNSIVIFESTVYPGLTDEVCVPILEKISNLKSNKDFYYGYSPERINPGDKKHQLTSIKKIVSGSNNFSSKKIKKLYESIIKVGTHMAPSIKVAEAAKVIENIQRDINVAFANELFKIFEKLNLNTYDILRAANTKWNFLDFKPGLVGGHCIGVDPYYLLYKCKKIKFKSEIITAGRKVNDEMSFYYANIINKQIIKKFKQKKIKILVMGYTFKENCSDTRNTKVIDIIKYFQKKKHKVHIYDPWVEKAKKNLNFQNKLRKKYYDCIIIAVKHKKFIEMGKNKISLLLKEKNILFDLKKIF